ncbi:hypothetical protein Bhyg_17844, partial [Pseudolycoriella hygida]
MESDLDVVNSALKELLKKKKLYRLSIELSDHFTGDLTGICKYQAVRTLTGLSILMNISQIKEDDQFYESLGEFPSHDVRELYIDFVPYVFLFKAIRDFVRQSPGMTPNTLKHFKSHHIKEMEEITKWPLTIYVRARHSYSVESERFGKMSLINLKSVDAINCLGESAVFLDEFSDCDVAANGINSDML